MKTRFGFSEKECKLLSGLDTPIKIQDFLDGLEYNLEEKGETYNSPRLVMRLKEADCFEGAIFAAAALRFQGRKPLLIDLICSKKNDSDHVLAVFKQKGRWGAIGKSKYTFLSYREPIYKSIRELAMTYFELYFNYWGKKTMRGFLKQPLNLALFDEKQWMTTEKSIKFIATYLDKVPHEKIMSGGMARKLRITTPLDKEAGELWIDRKGLLKKLKREGY